MVNHPNRAKTNPDHTLADACRQAGSPARLMWEISGPKGTRIAFLSCYLINGAACIVETIQGGGWQALTPCKSIQIVDTIQDVFNRCDVPVPPAYTAKPSNGASQ